MGNPPPPPPFSRTYPWEVYSVGEEKIGSMRLAECWQPVASVDDKKDIIFFDDRTMT
jgi:hypothetical protein